MANDPRRLEIIVEQIGETVIATTETVEQLAQKIDLLATQVEKQGQQQNYQIFALTEALQTLVDSQMDSRQQLAKLIETLQNFLEIIKNQNA